MPSGYLESPRDFAGGGAAAASGGRPRHAGQADGRPANRLEHNDLFKAFPRLDEDLRSYYALTYVPSRVRSPTASSTGSRSR